MTKLLHRQGVGISTGHDPYTRTLAANTINFDAIRQMGVDVVRIPCEWNTVQPANSSIFDWTIPDQLFDLADAQGLQVLFQLLGSPSWARTNLEPSAVYPPTDPTSFAIFVFAAVNRYKTRGSRGCREWEIWQEPNTAAGYGSTSYLASNYVNLIYGAYNAVKVADPLGTVVLGGIDGSVASVDTTWLTLAYGAGLQGKFDVLGFHPYARGLDPGNSSSTSNGWNHLSAIRAIMVANGDVTKPIWVTEVGQASGTGATAVSEPLQATYVGNMLQRVRDFPYIDRFYLHQDIDGGTDTTIATQNYGLTRTTGTAKPAFKVFRDNNLFSFLTDASLVGTSRGVGTLAGSLPTTATSTTLFSHSNGQVIPADINSGAGSNIIAAATGYANRFVPMRNMTVTKITISIGIADSADNAEEIAIYNVTCTSKLATSGVVTVGVNSTGMKTFTISASLVAGTIYYVVIVAPTVSTALQMTGAQYGSGVVAQLLGTDIPDVETFKFTPAASPMPSDISALTRTFQNSSPFMGIRTD